LEERRFSGLHTGIASWDENISGRESTSSGRSSDFVRNNRLADIFQIRGSENETDVPFNVRKQSFKLRIF
jgi:hypothetical protein